MEVESYYGEQPTPTSHIGEMVTAQCRWILMNTGVLITRLQVECCLHHNHLLALVPISFHLAKFLQEQHVQKQVRSSPIMKKSALSNFLKPRKSHYLDLLSASSPLLRFRCRSSPARKQVTGVVNAYAGCRHIVQISDEQEWLALPRLPLLAKHYTMNVAITNHLPFPPTLLCFVIILLPLHMADNEW
jgi:hypothetical protein